MRQSTGPRRVMRLALQQWVLFSLAGALASCAVTPAGALAPDDVAVAPTIALPAAQPSASAAPIATAPARPTERPTLPPATPAPTEVPTAEPTAEPTPALMPFEEREQNFEEV